MKKMELLFKVTKLLAENNLVYEGYSYCTDYDKEQFEKDFKDTDKDSWLDIAIDIINLIEGKSI